MNLKKVLLCVLTVVLILNFSIKVEANDGKLEDVIWHELRIPSSTVRYYITGGILTYGDGLSSELMYRERDVI